MWSALLFRSTVLSPSVGHSSESISVVASSRNVCGGICLVLALLFHSVVLVSLLLVLCFCGWPSCNVGALPVGREALLESISED